MRAKHFWTAALFAVSHYCVADCDGTISDSDKVGDVKRKLQCFATENAALKQQLQAATRGARPNFGDGQWRYFSIAGAGGAAVARRLTELGPPSNSVVVFYDGSAHNTFHVWYLGSGTGTKYAYDFGKSADLSDPPATGYFLPAVRYIPAGIGGVGDTAVPIFFFADK